MVTEGIADASVSFIQNTIGQIIALVLTVIGAAKWIDKKNDDKVEKLRREIQKDIQIHQEINSKDMNAIKVMITNIELLSNTERQFIEKEIDRLNRTIERFSYSSGGPGYLNDKRVEGYTYHNTTDTNKESTDRLDRGDRKNDENR